MRAILPDLYGYSRNVIRRYPWLGQDAFKDYVHDAVRDASGTLAGQQITRVWDSLKIDLATYCRGHVRSNIWKDANRHAVKRGRPLEEIEYFQGVPIDEIIALSGIKIDLFKVFKTKPEIMSVILIIFRDVYYSPSAISRELGITEAQVSRAWRKITSVARAMAEEAQS